MSSMVHSATLTVLTVMNIVSLEYLFCFENWGRTDGRHVQKQVSLPAVTVGRPRGSTSQATSNIRTDTICENNDHVYSVVWKV